MPDDIATRPLRAERLRAEFQPSSWNEEARTVDVVFTTGADVVRCDWWTDKRWIERLDVSAEAIDLSRLEAGAPVLDTHSSDALGDVVGVVERAWIKSGKGYATLRFSDREEVAGVVHDVASGILRNISVGYVVDQWDISEATRDSAEIRTAKRWTPYELSLVPVPADPGAQVRAASPVQPPAAPAAPKESNMPDIDPAADAAARTAEIEAARASAAAAERTRVAEIMAAQRLAGLEADWSERMIADPAITADAARKAALEAVAARATKRVDPTVAGSLQDATETHHRLLANAFEHRAGVASDLEQGARQFRGFRMLDFARASIEMHGQKAVGLTPIETFQRAMALSRRNQFMQRDGSMTTGDFPYLLANTASKSLRQGYDSAPRTFAAWAQQMVLPDFKTFDAVALSDAPALAAIGENAEVTYGSVSDGREQISLVRVGKALAISYVAMVNDDMSGFTRIPRLFGNAAARYESDTVYGILTTNAAMSDSVALFNASHSNSTTGVLSADATGVASVGSAVTLLRKQTAPNGDILGLQGRYLVVPAALEVKAMQLFSPAIVAASAGAVNPYKTTMQVIGEPRLDATSAAAFYVMADPNQIDTVWYAYLEGEQGPVISSDVDFDTDGMMTKVMHSFGAKAIDWRGMVYSTGA